MVQTPIPLEQLARADPVAAPLARLQALALAEAEQPGWAEGVPTLHFRSGEAPLLEGQTLLVEGDRQRGLLVSLAKRLEQTDSDTGKRLVGLFADRAHDPLGLLAASLLDDTPVLEPLAEQADVDVATLAVVAHVAALPLLLACGAQLDPNLPEGQWAHGSCPVCGAYPTLAELRGLARDRYLRCGRCGAGWPYPHDRCPFCESQDQKSQGYFAAEAERESRRAVTCDSCQGYLKTVATLGPLMPAQVLLRDLETLELDVTALEAGYQRPDRLGWQLSVRVEPAPARTAGRRLRWWT